MPKFPLKFFLGLADRNDCRGVIWIMMHVCGNKLARIFFGLHVISAIALFSLNISAQSLFLPSFTYQGKFMNAAGTSPLTGTVDLQFDIYAPPSVTSPASPSCVLYEEYDAGINLTVSNGSVAVSVGSLPGASKRTGADPQFSMEEIFANSGSLPTKPSCVAGYTPGSGDPRFMRVTVIQGGVPTVLSPDQMVTPVPQALVSETLQGIGPNGLIQVTGSGANDVSQANVAALVGGTDISALNLHNHDAHNDGRYARLGVADNFTGNLTTMGDIGIGTTNPQAPLDIEESTPSLRIGGTGSSGNTLSIDFYGNNEATNTASIKSADNSNTLSFWTGGTQAMSINSSQQATFASSVSVTGTLGLGQYTNLQETTLIAALTALGATAQGTEWENSTTHQLRYWDGTGAQTLAIVGGTTVTAVTASSPLVSSGGATPNISMPQATSSQSGYLASSDWATFNSKANSFTTGNLTESTSDVLTLTGNDGSVIGAGLTVQVQKATSTQDGYLSSTDWNTFNSKQNALAFGNLTESTSDVLTLTGNNGSVIGGGLTVQVKQAGASQDGFLSSTDWNTFNSKQNALGYVPVNKAGDSMSGALTFATWTTGTRPAAPVAGTTGFNTTTNQLESYDGTIWVAGTTGAITSISVSSPLTSSGGSTPTLSMPQATTSQSGYLASSDWTTFSNKVNRAGDTMTGALDINGSANSVQLAVQGSAGQTSDLTDWNNNAGTTLASIDNTGTFHGNGSGLTDVTGTISGLTGGRVTLSSTATTVTDSASLTFNSATGAMGFGGSAPGITSSGTFGINSNGANVNNQTGTSVALAVKGAGAQSADLVDVLNNTGTVLVNVSSAGNLNMNGNPINNVANPVANGDAVNEGYLNTQLNNYLPLSGGTMTGALNFATWTTPTRPASPIIGTTGFNTTTGYLESYTGTTWVDYSAGAAGTVSSVSASSPMTGSITGSTLNISMPQATTSQSGYLASSDWTTFSNKVNRAGDTMTGPLTNNSNSASTALAISQAGAGYAATFVGGNVGIGTTTPSSQLQVVASTSTTTGQIVQGAASQSSDLTDWENSAGTVLASVDSSGVLHGNGSGLTNVSGTDNTKVPLAGGTMTGQLTINDVTTNPLAINTSQFVVTTGGNVGIGTTVPASLVTLTGNNAITFTGVSAQNQTSTISTDSADNLHINAGLGQGKAINLASQVSVTASGTFVNPYGTGNSTPNLTIKGGSSQSRDLTDWENNSGTILVDISDVGNVGIGTTTTGAGLQVVALTSTTTGAIIQGASSQSNDLTDWENSAGTVLSYVDSSGVLHGNGSGLTNVSGTDNTKVPLAGGTMTGQLTINDVTTNPLAINTSQLVVATTGNVGVGTTSPASMLHVGVDPTASSHYGLASLGGGAFDGVTGAYFGSGTTPNSHGTVIAENTAATYTGDLANFQVGGYSKFTISNGGLVTAPQFYGTAGVGFLLNSGGSHWGTLEDAGTDVWALGYGNTGASTPVLVWNATGTVGIGTTAPGAQLEVDTSIATNKGSIIKGFASQSADLTEWQNSSGTVLSSVDSAGGFHGNGAGITNIAASSVDWTHPGTIGSATPNTGAFTTLTTTGTVGIGTTAPANTLSVVSAGPTIASFLAVNDGEWAAINVQGQYSGQINLGGSSLGNTNVSADGNTLSLDSWIGIAANNHAGQIAQFGTSNSSLNSYFNGHVGVGTTAPSSQLQVVASTAATTGQIIQGAASQSNDLTDWENSAGTVLALISSSGNVGVGTTSPALKMDVAGSAIFRGPSVGGVDGELFYSTTGHAYEYYDAGTATWIPLGTGTITYSGSIWSQNGSNAYYNSGEVGVGTTAPAGQFDVEGSGGVVLNAGDVGVGTTSPTAAGLQVSVPGSSSVSGEKLDGTWFTTGSATTNKPQLLVEPAGTSSSGWSVAGTGLGVNAANGFSGRLLDLQVNGSAKAYFDSTGTLWSGDVYAIGSNMVIRGGTGYAGGTGALSLANGNNMGPISGTVSKAATITGGTITTSSGTGTVHTLEFIENIVQSGTASGPTTSLYFNPSVTGSAGLTLVDNAPLSLPLSAGTSATALYMYHMQPFTFTDESSYTLASASTLQIEGAPIGSAFVPITRSSALTINSNTLSDVSSGYGLYVSAPTGATNNYAAAFATGNVGIGTTSPSALLHVLAATSTTTGQIIQGASGQSKDLTDWENSAGTVLSNIDSTGALYITSVGAANTAAVTKAYVTTALSGSGFLPLAGGTTTGTLTMADTSTNPLVINTNQLVATSGGSVGVGTTNPVALLDVHGHMANSGPAVTLGACGSSPSFTGNDARGTVSTGTGTVNSCVITFAAAYSTAPYCVATWNTATPPTTSIGVTTSTTALTVYFSASSPSTAFMYQCVQ